MSGRLTKKQRQKLKREAEAAHKRFMRRGELLHEQRAARDAAGASGPTESPRERHVREQREREEARIAARRAEHALPDGKVWAMVEACVGRTGQLCEKLRQAGIPFFRPRDEVEQVLHSGQVRRIQVPLFDRTVFVGVDGREELTQLISDYPWLMERQTYGTLSVRCDQEFAWDVERVARRQVGTDQAGNLKIAAVAIPGEEMRDFAETLIAAPTLHDDPDGFAIGEQVRVADGPFADFSGIVEAWDSFRGMLKVAVNIFGRSTPVDLARAQVERV